MLRQALCRVWCPGWRVGGLTEVEEDTGGYAGGQATSGEHPDIFYRRCPPLLVLRFGSPERDQRPPYGAYRVPLVDGATATGEVMPLG